jgi:hypothetical protein
MAIWGTPETIEEARDDQERYLEHAHQNRGDDELAIRRGPRSQPELPTNRCQQREACPDEGLSQVDIQPSTQDLGKTYMDEKV